MSDKVLFAIKVYIPQPKSGQTVRNINGFETNLPNFSHTLARLGSNVQFNKLSLRSSNGNIIADVRLKPDLYFATATNTRRRHYLLAPGCYPRLPELLSLSQYEGTKSAS